MSDPRSTESSEPGETEEYSKAELAERVEEKYDFENFGPREMAEMTPEEWEAAFDSDAWITGRKLLDRVEADLHQRIANRDVFAVLERELANGEDHLLAYSDEGYAIVYEDGSIEGSGTVLRDVKPSVALASMDDYDVPEVPEGRTLPTPEEVAEGSGDLGNVVIQAVAGIQVFAGLALLVAWIAFALPIIAGIAAFGFLLFGVLLFVLVANARLSDRFRAAEYRDRLRAVGVESGERPDFFPPVGERDDGQDDEHEDER